jgi:hypothetical protein
LQSGPQAPNNQGRVVELATGTQEHRKIGKIWLICGITDILFIFVTCFACLSYQLGLREKRKTRTEKP